MGDDFCAVCDGPLEGFFAGIAMWNGEIVANKDPGEWGGAPCCEKCFEKHERGELPTRHFVVLDEEAFRMALP